MGGRPLDGIVVLDLTRLLPGPMCTLHLADMGADVIKVEDPAGGDYARWLGPRQKVNTTAFLLFNRNKRSLTLDLKQPEGRDIFLKLAAGADMVVEGFRPGVADRLGVGFRDVQAVNPKAVFGSITGFGQDGPWALRAGHDINYLALAGVLDQTGTAGGPPALSNFQIADLAGGALTGAMGLLAALVQAQRTGRGGHVDVAMTDSVLAHTVIPLAGLAAQGGVSARRGEDRLTGGVPCYGVYPTADDRWLAVGALEPKFWQAFCTGIDRPDLLAFAFATGAEGELTRAAIAETTRTRSLQAWTDTFAAVDACVSPVLTPEEAIRTEHAIARNLVVTADHPVEGPVQQFTCPVRMDGAAFDRAEPAPMQGQHTGDILAGLGYDAAAIADLRQRRVV